MGIVGEQDRNFRRTGERGARTCDSGADSALGHRLKSAGPVPRFHGDLDLQRDAGAQFDLSSFDVAPS